MSEPNDAASVASHDADACPGCDHECLSCGAYVPQGGSACGDCRPMMERAASEADSEPAASLAPDRVLICPECGNEVPITINAAVTLTGHLEDDHGFGFERVMRTVVAHANGSSTTSSEVRG